MTTPVHTPVRRSPVQLKELMLLAEQNGKHPDQPILVIHGPEIFDSGEGGWLIDRIQPSRTIVAGVMARTAAEESNLPVEFQGEPPSSVIRSLTRPCILANHGKSPESGRIFGNIVASRLQDTGLGLVQIECSSRTVFIWDDGSRALASALSHLTGFILEEAASTRDMQRGRRSIRGCIPGEAVYVNGIIIGRAMADTVVLCSSEGGIEPVSGLAPKVHGIEKLIQEGPIDLSAAWCKSGPIRSAPPRQSARTGRTGSVVVIDHCGHEIYRRIGHDCCGVLAIGDDTTAVCGHICAHRGIPVLGVVDGDGDGIVLESFAAGSVVIQAETERDDDIGTELAPMAGERSVLWDDWVKSVLQVLGDRVKVVVDTRERPDAVR
jgi:hypothetical protein